VGLQVAGAQNRILAGETEGVIERIRNGLELDSTNWLLHMQLGWAHEVRKEWKEAADAYERAARFGRATSVPKAHLARALVFTGREHEARDLLSALRAEARKTGVYAPQVATVLAALGETEAAVDWLELAIRQRPPALPHALAEPGFESLRRHPRVVALLRENGLPQ
jgi:Flp pilus assembly protein TadD